MVANQSELSERKSITDAAAKLLAVWTTGEQKSHYQASLLQHIGQFGELRDWTERQFGLFERFRRRSRDASWPDNLSMFVRSLVSLGRSDDASEVQRMLDRVEDIGIHYRLLVEYAASSDPATAIPYSVKQLHGWSSELETVIGQLDDIIRPHIERFWPYPSENALATNVSPIARKKLGKASDWTS